MKKTLIVSILTIFLLSACGSRTTRTVSTVAPETDSSGMTTNYTNALPIDSQLLVGIFKLEGTDKAVNAKQAADLLTYWQLLKDLTTSGSAAQEEINATVDAIESAMTPDQINAIIAMQLTWQDMVTILREQGGSGATANQSGSSNSNSQPNFNFGPPGGFDGGVPPSGGFGGDGFNGGAGTQQNNANRSSNGQTPNNNANFSSRIPSALFDAVIKLLEDKAKP